MPLMAVSYFLERHRNVTLEKLMDLDLNKEQLYYGGSNFIHWSRINRNFANTLGSIVKSKYIWMYYTNIFDAYIKLYLHQISPSVVLLTYFEHNWFAGPFVDTFNKFYLSLHLIHDKTAFFQQILRIMIPYYSLERLLINF